VRCVPTDQHPTLPIQGYKIAPVPTIFVASVLEGVLTVALADADSADEVTAVWTALEGAVVAPPALTVHVPDLAVQAPAVNYRLAVHIAVGIALRALRFAGLVFVFVFVFVLLFFGNSQFLDTHLLHKILVVELKPRLANTEAIARLECSIQPQATAMGASGLADTTCAAREALGLPFLVLVQTFLAQQAVGPVARLKLWVVTSSGTRDGAPAPLRAVMPFRTLVPKVDSHDRWTGAPAPSQADVPGGAVLHRAKRDCVHF